MAQLEVWQRKQESLETKYSNSHTNKNENLK